MADIKSPDERSRNMAAIKGKNTKPEIYLRKLLFAKGFRYRTNVPYIFGRPDIWMRKYNTAIFVHGCYWHRHSGCKYSYVPKSRIEFWNAKFDNNQKRDIQVQNTLTGTGIKCLVVWECSLKKMKKDETFQQQCLDQITEFIQSSVLFAEI